jgi:hypothetical protein
MEQALVRRLKRGTLDAYRMIAREKGTSLEAELRGVLEAHAPRRKKNPEELIRLSSEALAMTPPDGAGRARLRAGGAVGTRCYLVPGL